MSQDIQKFTIRRDGKKDLSFRGQLIAEASDHEHQGPQNTRWSEIDIYRTDSGAYVVSQTFVTRWKQEYPAQRDFKDVANRYSITSQLRFDSRQMSLI
ncbi:MAG: hypothetical protein M0Z32_01000 [Actinomycetota bacterium]|jgi:hypothetical protein|nr:hypothetical protein [Actinomycetota bacterium]MCL6093536.1 hypothetical protein [Actinomycetota bacterium]MDA8166322.1 hypothetical protein [Actinomycetota bacterium]